MQWDLLSRDEGPFVEVVVRGGVDPNKEEGLTRRALSWSCWRTCWVKRAWRAESRYRKAVSPSWWTPYEARERWSAHRHWPITQRCTRGWKPYSRNTWHGGWSNLGWWNCNLLHLYQMKPTRMMCNLQPNLLLQCCSGHVWKNLHSDTTGWRRILDYNCQTVKYKVWGSGCLMTGLCTPLWAASKHTWFHHLHSLWQRPESGERRVVELVWQQGWKQTAYHLLLLPGWDLYTFPL